MASGLGGAGGRRGLSKGLERPLDLVLGSGSWEAEQGWEEHGLRNPSPALGGGWALGAQNKLGQVFDSAMACLPGLRWLFRNARVLRGNPPPH